jgi:hypothetical protein
MARRVGIKVTGTPQFHLALARGEPQHGLVVVT